MKEFKVRGRMVTVYKHQEAIEAASEQDADRIARTIMNGLLNDGLYIKDQVLGTKLSRILSIEEKTNSTSSKVSL